MLTNPGTCRFYIGGFPLGDQCAGTAIGDSTRYPGLIDDVRIYDRPLSGSEIYQLYDAR